MGSFLPLLPPPRIAGLAARDQPRRQKRPRAKKYRRKQAAPAPRRARRPCICRKNAGHEPARGSAPAPQKTGGLQERAGDATPAWRNGVRPDRPEITGDLQALRPIAAVPPRLGPDEARQRAFWASLSLRATQIPLSD